MNCVKQLALQDAECASASASKDAPAASKAEKDLLWEHNATVYT